MSESLLYGFAGVFVQAMSVALPVSVIILGLLLITRLTGMKYKMSSYYILWTLVVLRIALPFSARIFPSLFNVSFDVPAEVDKNIVDSVPVQIDEGKREFNFSTEAYPESKAEVYQVPSTAETTVDKAEVIHDSGSPVPVKVAVDKSLALPDVPVHILVLGLCGIVWAGVAVLYAVRGIVSYNIYINSVKKCAIPAPEDIKSTYYQMCERFGVRRVPEIYIYTDASSPMVCGFFKSIMILPDISFTQNDLVGVFAHELTHLRRRDTWMKLLGMLAKSVNWYNPLVYGAVYEQQRYMELSCDESALSGLSDAARFAYGGVVLDIIKKCRENKTELTTGFSHRKSLAAERLREIIGKRRKRRGVWVVLLTLVLVVFCGNVMSCRLSNDETGSASTDTENFVEDESGEDTAESGETLPEKIRLDCGGYTVVLPGEYGGIYSAEAFPAEDEIVSVSYTAGAGDFDGYLFSIRRDREVLLSRENYVNNRYFAKDGQWYYYYSCPTDVRYNPQDEKSSSEYVMLSQKLGEICDMFIRENRLEAYSLAEDDESKTIFIPKNVKEDGSCTSLLSCYGYPLDTSAFVETEDGYSIPPLNSGSARRVYVFGEKSADGVIDTDSLVAYEYSANGKEAPLWAEVPVMTKWVAENYGNPVPVQDYVAFDVITASCMNYNNAANERLGYNISLNLTNGTIVIIKATNSKNEDFVVMDGNFSVIEGKFYMNVKDSNGEYGITGKPYFYNNTVIFVCEGDESPLNLDGDVLPLCFMLGSEPILTPYEEAEKSYAENSAELPVEDSQFYSSPYIQEVTEELMALFDFYRGGELSEDYITDEFTFDKCDFDLPRYYDAIEVMALLKNNTVYSDDGFSISIFLGRDDRYLNISFVTTEDDVRMSSVTVEHDDDITNRIIGYLQNTYVGPPEDYSMTFELERINTNYEGQLLKFAQALVRGDTSRLEELSGVESGMYDELSDIVFGRHLIKLDYTTPEPKLILWVNIIEGLDGMLSSGIHCYTIEFGLFGIRMTDELNAEAEKRGNSAEVIRLLLNSSYYQDIPTSDEMDDDHRWCLTEYIMFCLSDSGKDDFTLDELQAYAKNYFGIENFTPSSRNELDGLYRILPHGGITQCGDIVSVNENGDYSEVTVQYYSDYNYLAKSDVYLYRLKKIDGRWGIVSSERISEGRFKPMVWAV